MIRESKSLTCFVRATSIRVVLVVLGVAVMSASGLAQCTQWDASGQWDIEVTSGPRKKAVAHVDLRQSGKKLSGKVINEGHGGVATVNDGTADGDKFHVYISWDGKDAEGLNYEVYLGKIGSNGMIAGTAILFGDRSAKAAWASNRSMKCIAGSIKQRAPGGYGAVTTVPGILAYIKPGQAAGTKTLSWDAGPDHPYAEVWVRVGDGDETFVVEKGKGKRQVTVEPGKPYLYILTDAGKRLATVTVKSQ